ncbi:putative HTH-type transcriptional regulator YttP [invertebrate metagenome]|uniref:Putative HTH-type transcriptional regulator YttP n=1 Tax=invertebrate metagenome TaxID=1711999 RepID=A0A2H9T5S1_9ZZZZ
MPQVATVQRILDTAERLFAQQGFSETSLRMITGEAQVNLASVNYYFGSKKSLIQAVFARFMDPFVERLQKAIQHIQSDDDQDNLESLLRVLVDEMISVEQEQKKDLMVFMQLLGLAYSQTQGHLKKYLYEKYSDVLHRYMRLLIKACPDLDESELFWRVNFILGAAVFTLSGASTLRAIARSDYHMDSSIPDILRKMVPFMAAGLRAHAGGVD